jgi:hypothetical protein
MKCLALLAAAASLLHGERRQAQYPDKPVRIIVPFIAGSAPDVAARQVAQRLTAGPPAVRCRQQARRGRQYRRRGRGARRPAAAA